MQLGPKSKVISEHTDRAGDGNHYTSQYVCTEKENAAMHSPPPPREERESAIVQSRTEDLHLKGGS